MLEDLRILQITYTTAPRTGAVASALPTWLAHFVRDSRGAWKTFNAWTWALTGPAIALGQPSLLRHMVRTVHEAHDIAYQPHCAGRRRLAQDYAAMCLLDVYHHGSSGGGAGGGADAAAAAACACDTAAAPGLRPTVVFVHGGAWSHGSKELFALLGRRVRDAGFVCVVVGYRRYPAADAHGAAADVGAATAWVQEHVAAYGGDPGRVTLAAHSSGAHVAALHLLSRRGLPSQRAGAARAFVALCGVYDAAAHFEHERRRGVHEVSALKIACGGRDGGGGGGSGGPSSSNAARFASASPTVLVAREAAAAAVPLPKTFLFHSADDTTVPAASSVAFHRALLAHRPEARAELEVADAGGHGGILVDAMLGKPGARLFEVLRSAAQLPAE